MSKKASLFFMRLLRYGEQIARQCIRSDGAKKERRVSTPLIVTKLRMNYFPGVVAVPEEDDPGVVELLPEVEPEVEFTLLLLSFLSFLSFFAFLSVLVELALWSLLLEVEFVVSLGELTPGAPALPGVVGEVWAMANGLRLIERAGTSKKASLFFMLLAPSERRCSYAV